MKPKTTFFASSPKGMEDLLQDELKNLGLKETKQKPAGVYFQGTLQTAYRVCLWSRLANRVFYPISEFSAGDADELYAQIREIDWSHHLDVDSTFAVDFHAVQSGIQHTHYGALKVKDAVVDQFRSKYARRPSINTDKPDVRINLFLKHDRATVSIDLSGESLHKRGYRLDASAAPLKENLAAAILIRAGWPEIAADGGGLLDPMCGSGTLPIEAALMAGDSAPGLMRNYFGFFKWKPFDRSVWEPLVEEAIQREEAGSEKIPPMVGYDAHSKTIGFALQNLKRAGLEGKVHFEKKEFAQCVPHKKLAEPGLFIMNPPYGERMGEAVKLKPLYASIGSTLREHFENWRATIFTSNMDLGKSMGIRSRKSYSLYNGKIKCKVLNFTVIPQWYTKSVRSSDKPINLTKDILDC